MNSIHLSEINTILIDSTTVSITTYLLCELVKNKIKVIFCDERHQPQSELIGYYDNFECSKRIKNQIGWSDEVKGRIWTKIIGEKILNQSDHLKKQRLGSYGILIDHVGELEIFDPTNREAAAARVYFMELFGTHFTRDDNCDINAALNYGYSLILSRFNQEITNSGYLTQLGFKHSSSTNPYNLSSDLMEPFRVLVDEVVYEHREDSFDNKFKLILLDLLNKQVRIDNKQQYLVNAITIYVRSVFNAIEHNDPQLIKFMEFE